jgi:hypothetical protein
LELQLVQQDAERPVIVLKDVQNPGQSARNELCPLNKKVIAIDQDVLGHQGVLVRQDKDPEAWSKQLADGGESRTI